MTSADAYKTDHIISPDWLKAQKTQAVFEAIEAGGFQIRAVGGSIRNTLLGHPVKDIDLATTASPEISQQLAEQAGLKVIPTGLQHGTITVMSEGEAFEVTTLRTDVETDGRHAKVAFTDNWKEDASRRDFTINALYTDRHGTLYDPIDGYQDILSRKLKFIGTARNRIREDYLRILRYFRFQSEYDLKALDSTSLLSCVQEREGLRRLSAERIATEIERLLKGPYSKDIIRLMFEHGMLSRITGTVCNPLSFEKLLCLEKTLNLPNNAMLRLAALACNSFQDAKLLGKRFKLSNEKKTTLEELFEPAFHIEPDMPELQAKTVLYHMGKTAYQNRILFSWIKSCLPETHPAWQNQYTLAEHWQIPEFPIKGRDLIEAGFSKGPELGILLKKLENYWISMNFSPSKVDLLEQAKNL